MSTPLTPPNPPGMKRRPRSCILRIMSSRSGGRPPPPPEGPRPQGPPSPPPGPCHPPPFLVFQGIVSASLKPRRRADRGAGVA